MVLLAGLIALSPAQAARHALLVGIGRYQDPDVTPLAGPSHDVAALRDVLQRRWGFRPADIRSLLDGQATKARILAELDDLARRGTPGDELLIYFSGHGTSQLDAAVDAPSVPHGSGALVAHDFSAAPARLARGDGLVIGRSDLVPRILALEAAGRRLWVVMDTCFSGQAVREASGATRPAELSKRAIILSRPNAADDLARTRQRIGSRDAPPPYPYQATAFLSAADEGESARDLDGNALKILPTLDGKPHGALTDALLRVLEGQIPADLNADGRMDLNEVHRAVGDFMARRPYAHTPQRLPALAEDRNNLSTRPVLDVSGAASVRAGLRQEPPPLLLAVDDLPRALVARLSGLPGVRAARPGEPADLRVMPSSGGAGLDVVDAAGDLRRRWAITELDGLTQHLRQLAWLHRVTALAEAGTRGVLAMGFTPALGQGDSFAVGQEFSLALKPEHSGWLLVFNQESSGRFVSVHPRASYQTGELKAQTLWTSAPWRVEPPNGKDTQMAFLFSQRPKDLDEWVRLSYGGQDKNSPRLQLLLERMLAENIGQYSTGHSSFRTITLKP